MTRVLDNMHFTKGCPVVDSAERDRSEEIEGLRNELLEMRAWAIETMGNLRSASSALRAIADRAEAQLNEME